ncbi:MAG: energy-coupling factor ABC transporter permease [Desulfuromonas sp.]|nr:MAG: energy-coupling factor ABC transporter permease [Desulfuromonas sp.]
MYMIVSVTGVLVLVLASQALAMHITEGLLPWKVASFWFVVALPFVAAGIWQMTKRKKESPTYMPMVGIFGAAVFVFSCLPVPIPGIGATAHPAGTGFSAILLGPLPSVVVAFVSLLLQGLFLAHGGLTTLGANTFSMGVLGSFAGIIAFVVSRKLRFNLFWAGFLAGAMADFFTYLGTSIGLASGLHGSGSYLSEVAAIFTVLAPYVVVLMLIEGVLTGSILVYVRTHRPDILRRLKIIPAEEGV